jgi:hypothetical protein
MCCTETQHMLLHQLPLLFTTAAAGRDPGRPATLRALLRSPVLSSLSLSALLYN